MTDLFPLWNSLRIAAISSVIVFFAGIFAAYKAAKLPRVLKGILDVVLTLPMVLPPTVCGWFLLMLFGTRRPLGSFLAELGLKLVMNRNFVMSVEVARPIYRDDGRFGLIMGSNYLF